jgi:hypothetical protein
MKSSVNVRIIAALASACTTYAIVSAVVALADVPRTADAQLAKAPVASRHPGAAEAR